MGNDTFAGKRVFVYARVSTTRQEKNDLSLLDQIATAERWIEDNGAQAVRVFSEAGSATDDHRRAFREMIALTESDEHPIDIILAHSLSRLFRNALDFMQYRERLRGKKIRILGDAEFRRRSDVRRRGVDARYLRRVSFGRKRKACSPHHGGQRRQRLLERPDAADRLSHLRRAAGARQGSQEAGARPETVDMVRYIFKTYREGTANDPIGVTGLAHYLMTSTGKSGQYRYYACSARIKRGPEAWSRCRVPMEQLDDLVVGAMARHLFQPERLTALLQTWLDRSETAVAERAAELKRPRGRLTQLAGERARVIKLVRLEVLSPDDPQVATELGNIRAQRASTQADIAVLERQLDAGDRRITPAIIAKFGDLLRRKLHELDGRTRKEYIHLLVDRVEVGDRDMRITVRNAMLERAIIASQTPGAAVPKAERKWRTRCQRKRRKSRLFLIVPRHRWHGKLR